MKDVFNDSDFEKFLYGGVHDLEEPVGELVYNLWKRGIETTWSCAGHIGKFLIDAGNATNGYFAYEDGKLFYSLEPRTNILSKKLTEIVDRNPRFARIERRDCHYFILTMDDIAIKMDNLGINYAKLQVLP